MWWPPSNPTMNVEFIWKVDVATPKVMQVWKNQAPHRKNTAGWGCCTSYVEMVFSSRLLKKKIELLPPGSSCCLNQILGVHFPQRFGRAPLPNWIWWPWCTIKPGGVTKFQPVVLLMEEILHQLICSVSHYLQGFIHLRCWRISFHQPYGGGARQGHLLVFSSWHIG